MKDLIRFIASKPFASLFSVTPILLTCAFIVDLIIGDPYWLPHPVRIIGKAINKLEPLIRKYCRTNIEQKIGGLLLTLFVTASTFVITYILIKIFLSLKNVFLVAVSWIFVVYLASTTIAYKGLIDATKSVVKAIENKNIIQARAMLSMIVGRDTDTLNEKQILRADIETLSENLSDGVIAPLFYLVLGGIPVALTYKAINTLDNMLGYKNEKYFYFGWASARLDDVVNYLPARITGVLISLSTGILYYSFERFYTALKTMIRDGRKHPSPNSGFPESAMAGALGITMGGSSTYAGILVKKPIIGVERTADYLSSAKQSIVIARGAYLFAIGIVMLTLLLKSGVWIIKL